MVFFSNFVKAPGATEPSANPGMTKKHANTSKLAVGESRLKQDIYIYIYIISSRNMWLKKKWLYSKDGKIWTKKFRAHPSWHQNLEDKPARLNSSHSSTGSTLEAPKKSWKTHRQDTFRRKRYASVSCHFVRFSRTLQVATFQQLQLAA